MPEQNGDRPRGLYLAPDQIEAPEKVSQTLLSRIDVCPYSGYLYVKHKGGPPTPEMARGTAFHDFAEQATNYLMEEGEPRMPPEVAKDMIQAILAERVDLAIPQHEQDACRLMAWNWGAGMYLDLEHIVGVEQTLELQIGNWLVRGKLDFLSFVNRDAWVKDYKTSKRVLPQEVYENSYQPQMYGLLALEGTPEGEDVPLGKGLEGVHCQEIYPRYRKSASLMLDDFSGEEGELVFRHAYYDRPQMADFRRSVEGLLSKLEHGLRENEWAAQMGTHCSTCAASSECPIPERLRKVKTIGTEGDAMEVAQRIEVSEREIGLDKDALKVWIDNNGELVMGDVIWDFHLIPMERKDKEAIAAFLEEHGFDPAPYLAKDSKELRKMTKAIIEANGGDPAKFYKTSETNRFGRREVAEEPA